jgi:hypothetical protein
VQHMRHVDAKRNLLHNVLIDSNDTLQYSCNVNEWVHFIVNVRPSSLFIKKWWAHQSQTHRHTHTSALHVHTQFPLSFNKKFLEISLLLMTQLLLFWDCIHFNFVPFYINQSHALEIIFDQATQMKHFPFIIKSLLS